VDTRQTYTRGLNDHRPVERQELQQIVEDVIDVVDKRHVAVVIHKPRLRARHVLGQPPAMS